MTWTKVEPLRWNLMAEGIQLGCVFPVRDGIRAWAWPTANAQKTMLGDFITVGRAMEAVDGILLES